MNPAIDFVVACESDDLDVVVAKLEARDREVRAAALREANEYLTGYSGFLGRMGFGEAANGVGSVCCVFEAAAASGNSVAAEAAKP